MIALPHPSPLALTRRGLLAGGAALAALPGRISTTTLSGATPRKVNVSSGCR